MFPWTFYAEHKDKATETEVKVWTVQKRRKLGRENLTNVDMAARKGEGVEKEKKYEIPYKVLHEA